MSGNVSQTARELGISDETLHGWKSKFGTSKVVTVSETTSADLAARVAQLERQLVVRNKQIEVSRKCLRHNLKAQHQLSHLDDRDIR